MPSGWENIAALGETVPGPEVLYAPVAYDPMDVDNRGEWRWIMPGTTKIGIAWTDWQKSAGVIEDDGSELDAYFAGLRAFLSAGKDMGMPAGAAYVCLGAHIQETAPKGVTLGDIETGILSDVLESMLDNADEDDTETDNGDHS